MGWTGSSEEAAFVQTSECRGACQQLFAARLDGRVSREVPGWAGPVGGVGVGEAAVLLRDCGGGLADVRGGQIRRGKDS